MATVSPKGFVSLDTVTRCIRIVHYAASAGSFQEWRKEVLPEIARFTAASELFVYLKETGKGPPVFLSHRIEPEEAVQLEAKISAFSFFGSKENPIGQEPAARPLGDYRIHELICGGIFIGFLGRAPEGPDDDPNSELWQELLEAIAGSAATVAERLKIRQELTFLSAYMNVSSLVAQFMDLRELLENILYFCTDSVQAEEASVLLLDDEKKNFFFYQSEGPTKPLLITMRFSSTLGIAGAALASQQSEIISDVQADPRFFRGIDSESGIKTRNMIVVPLTAGEEQVGILEVINKIGGGAFQDRERLLLQSIAEEIAFAIRNARIFEVVVNSYCKQRQGLNTCKGCKRPLGSWTPCVKYRQPDL